ncbi:MAG: aminotransferase class I/II-fold pyridoxal phosphate-dependent enzyme [Calditrichota bacterium]
MSAFKVIPPAARTEHVTYAVRDIVVLADKVKHTGKEMLYLNIGDPNQFDFSTPPHLVEAMYRALQGNKNGYAPSSGIPEAVAAVRRDAERKGLRNIRDIFITTGASEAIDLCLSALVNREENVLTPAPGYPLYTAVLARLEARENPYFLDESNGWQPNIDDIASKINESTRAIVLINPNNPTGSNCSRETLQALIDLAVERGIVIFADEIYDRLLFDGEKHVSIASLNPDAPVITFSGLSKNYLGPGLRIGWGIVTGPEELLHDFIEGVNKLLRARLCANHPMQYAVQPALEGSQAHLDEVLRKLTARRNLTVRMLNDIEGISCVAPKGAFYAYPQLHIKGTDTDFVHGLIRETGVVVVPGEGFGQVPGTKHFRVVFLPNDQILEKAYNSIRAYTKRWLEKEAH